MVFAPPWLTPKGNFSEMFLVLLGRKSDGNEGYVGRVFKDFVFYCIYGRVQAILTYRVYQLYDTCSVCCRALGGSGSRC